MLINKYMMTEQEANEYLKNEYPTSNWQDGIERHVKNWVNFVNEIADGSYDGIIEEYFNDLDTRLILAEVGYEDEPRVKAADDIFRSLLVHTETRIWGYVEDRKDDWWNFGHPKSVSSDLKKEFETDYRYMSVKKLEKLKEKDDLESKEELSKLCPVCGFYFFKDFGYKPWDGEVPCYEICPSCGIQFGYDDAAGGSQENRIKCHNAWRKRFLQEGKVLKSMTFDEMMNYK